MYSNKNKHALKSFLIKIALKQACDFISNQKQEPVEKGMYLDLDVLT